MTNELRKRAEEYLRSRFGICGKADIEIYESGHAAAVKKCLGILTDYQLREAAYGDSVQIEKALGEVEADMLSLLPSPPKEEGNKF